MDAVPQPAPAADTTLLAGVRAGDREALAQLHDRYAGRVHGLALRVVRNRALAEEVTQEVFLAVWRAATGFDAGRGSVAAWIVGLAHHKAVDAVRREDVHARRRSPAEVLALHEAEDASPEDAAWGSVRDAGVRDALARLPEPQREVLVLAYFGAYTQREIAAITGAPLGTVKTRTLLGMRRLRELLAGLSDDAWKGVAG